MPDALTTRDLISMGSIIETTLPGTAVLHRKASVSDGQGGHIDTWTAYGTVSCRISPMGMVREGEEVHADRMTTVTERVVTMPRLTDITTKDRIVESGVTYEVVVARDPRSYELARRVQVVEVD